MTAAEPVQWPGQYVAAASFTFDVDAEAAVLTRLPGAVGRPSMLSQQAYGPLVGVPRLLRVLQRHQVRATFFVPGHTAHRYPDTVKAIVDAGHEVAHHGYLHELLVGVEEAEEREILERGLAALDEVAGVRPTGYRAPMWELTRNSLRLLAEYGFGYDSSLMDADVPYELRVTADSSLVEIPVSWGLDDWEQYCFIPDLSEGVITNPTTAVDTWRQEFDALRAEGGCFVLTNHPFLSGRPGRAAALAGLLDHVTSRGDVWVAPLAEIADHVRSLGRTPRTLPFLPPPSPEA